MGCGGKKCCCSGCTPVVDQREVRVGCCKCIPTGICVGITTYYGDSYEKVIWKKCGQLLEVGDTEMLIFEDTFLIGGLTKTVSFLMVMEQDYAECDGSSRECSFCVEIDGVRDCHLIDHYTQHDNADTPDNPCPSKSEFCCTFAASFELELSDVSGTITITTAAPELIDRTSSGQKCAGCNCICACACIGVASLIGSSNTQICSELDSGGNITWTTADGFSIGLVGNESTGFVESILDSGTVLSGVDSDVLDLDRTFHILEPVGGQIDVSYKFQNNSTDYSRSMTWSGYIVGYDATASLFIWNWSTGYWELLCEPQGATQTDYGIPRSFVIDADNTGTGLDEGLIRVRLLSDTATQIGTDAFVFKTPNCCRLSLISTPDEYTPDEGTEPADVDIDAINDCPSPTASWSYFTYGEAVHVYFDCAFCEECAGTTLPCCPNPIPRVLTATLEMDCGVCSDALEFPLVYEPGDAGWTGGPASGSCFDIISVIWPDGSEIDSCFDVTMSVGSACTSVTETVTGSCDPIHVVITGYFDECINVCSDLSTAPPIDFTLTITE